MNSKHTSEAGADTLLPLLKRRTPLYHANVPFIVCWAQKSGCTAVLKWFLHHAGLLDEATQYKSGNMRLGVHSYENKVLKRRPHYKDELITGLQRGKPIINFLRCPFERAFSSYMILNNGWFLEIAERGDITPGLKVRQAVLGFVYGQSGDLNRPISFRHYLLWLAEQDFSALDPHHTPQYSPLYQHFPVTHYRLKDFDIAIGKLEADFSMNSSTSAKRSFSSGHHRPKRDTPAPDALRLFEEGLPLERFPLDALPRVTRSSLQGSWFETAISELMAADIELYEKIEPLRPTNQR